MAKLDYLQDKKLTPADEVRALLRAVEERLSRLKSLHAAEAIELLRDLDHLQRLIEELSPTVDLLSEQGRFDSIQRRLRGLTRLLLKRIGGAAAVADQRSDPPPPPENWWWYIDEMVARQQRGQLRRILVWAVVAIIVIAGGIWAYRNFMAPSPQALARYEAEQALFEAIETEDYEAALIAIEQGLAQIPGDPGLLLSKGVLLEKLGREAEADPIFAEAKTGLDDPLSFYYYRGQMEFRLDRLEKAEANVRQAIAIDEDQSRSWLLLGQVLEAKGETFKAVSAYERAGQLGMDNGDNEVVVMARMALARLGMEP